MRAKQGGARLGDITEDGLFLRRKSSHRLHQIGDQVGSPLQDHVHLGPRGVHRLAFHDHLIPAADERTSQHQPNDHQNNQKDQSYFHLCLDSVEFTNAHSSRAAIPAWESDAPACPRFSPMPLDTHRTPEQFRRGTRLSRAASAGGRTPPCQSLSTMLLAQQYHALTPAALLRKQSPHAAAASALRKTIFAAPAPVLSNSPARADSVAATSAASCASHVRSAHDANSSALRFLLRRLRHKALGARASYPEFRWRRRPRHASARLS